MQDKLRKTMGEIWRSIKENKKKVILAAIVVVALVAVITILLLNRQRSVTASGGNASGGENAVKNTEITTPKESVETSKAPQEDDSSKIIMKRIKKEITGKIIIKQRQNSLITIIIR